MVWPEGSELLGFLLALTLAAVAGLLVGLSRLPGIMKLLVVIALGLRVFGTVARHTMLFQYYDGIGDATGYYRRGLHLAERLWQFDFTPVSSVFLNPRSGQ